MSSAGMCIPFCFAGLEMFTRGEVTIMASVEEGTLGPEAWLLFSALGSLTLIAIIGPISSRSTADQSTQLLSMILEDFLRAGDPNMGS